MEKFLIRAAGAFLALSLTLGVSAAAAGEELVPMGDVVGISVASRGAVVSGFEESGDSPAEKAGIITGDVIIAIGGREVASAKEAAEALESMAGKSMNVTVLRHGEKKDVTLTAGDAGEGRGLLGVWLRDTLSGIGTVTYYDPESGEFGALGHPVSDLDSDGVLPVREGVILSATVTDSVAGSRGQPGQLKGDIDFLAPLGKVETNTPVGIYGTAAFDVSKRESVPVAARSEIKTGECSVLSGALGTVEEYSAEITRIYPEGVREMMIKITDPRLLETTGGIVQGMSGSPIIQNGRLIGAVTHVLVSDPAMGYAVSLEKMLSESGEMMNAA